MSLMTPDGGLLFWMTIIFLIVFFILAKFGFPVITGMVEKRRNKIADAMKLAEEAEQKFAHLSEEQDKLIRKTEEEREKMLNEASRMREEMIAKAALEAQAEAKKIMDNASKAIQAEKEEAMRGLRQEIATFSVEVAEKILKNELSSASSEKAFIDKTLEEVSKLDKIN